MGPILSFEVETDLVKCDVCGAGFTIEEYIQHMTTHVPQMEKLNSMDSLPTAESQLSRAQYKSNAAERECRICLQEYVEKESLIYLPCMHSYHEDCILKWFRKLESLSILCTCPACLKQVFK